MKNPSKTPGKIIVPKTIAILASSSRLLHFKPGMIVRLFDWHIWPQWKIIRLNVLQWKRGLHSKQRPTCVYPAYGTRRRVPQRDRYFSRRPTPSKHFPRSSSVTFDLLIHDFQDGAFRVLFETVCQRYRAINPASDRGFKFFFSLWCPLRRGKKEEPMVLEKS